jgi:hypothetical protein
MDEKYVVCSVCGGKMDHSSMDAETFRAHCEEFVRRHGMCGGAALLAEKQKLTRLVGNGNN